jgi:queuine tRNA-ribosyltransferase
MAKNGRLDFKLLATATGSRARAASFRTLHNEVLTPLFMPVGTRATVRHQQLGTMEQLGSQILLANTYHLHLSPGPEVFSKIGGIHKFMNWNKSVLTDSGGFQIFSLPGARNMSEEGASFKSYINGDLVMLSPERSIQTQKAIGSDIMMVLDQCVPSTVDHATAKSAMELSYRWAKRSLSARGESPQSMFGIIQGACFRDLRKISAELTTSIDFDGYAIGGLAVGETKAEREDFTEFTTEFMPHNKPRYLMGVGTPIDLLEAVHRGVDMFDCIIPGALASQGVAYTSIGRLRLSRGVYKFSEQALDPACECHVCKNYSRAYLHHLHKTKEPLGTSLIGEHNIAFYHSLMRKIRSTIIGDTFLSFYKQQQEVLAGEDLENPVTKPKKLDRSLKNSELGNYQICFHKDGEARIKQKSSGEVMHSVNDPNEEARTLYVEQSQLIKKLQNIDASDKSATPLVIWDVGLGAGYNAMACVHAIEREDKIRRPLHIISFENDLNSLQLALIHASRFSHLHHPAPSFLLKNHLWDSPTHDVRWTLALGDFLEQMEQAPSPDVIFYDPFSANADSKLWTLDTFKKLFTTCAVKQHVELFTYSASTAVRATLLGAGFWVAKGIATGPKTETTVAISPELCSVYAQQLLSQDWLDRWKRSHTQTPLGCNPSQHWQSLIPNHPQFMILHQNQ